MQVGCSCHPAIPLIFRFQSNLHACISPLTISMIPIDPLEFGLLPGAYQNLSLSIFHINLLK